MKKNKEITEDKTPKKDNDYRFSFRTSQAMYEMVKLRIGKLSLDTSKYIKILVEKDLEEEAKEIRLEQEAKKEEAIIVKENYAQYDKKLKRKKGNYAVDEPKNSTLTKEDYAPLIALFLIILAAIIYYANRFLTRRNEEKSYERRLKLWQSYQNPPPYKVEIDESDRMLDKSVEQD